MNKEYRCICGKVFDNPQKFNGHKSNCKEHILNKYGDQSSQYFEYQLSRCKQGGKTTSHILINRKQEKIDQWISEQHTCEKCGKVMTEKYGSGRFCSRSCANSHNKSEEEKQIVSQSLKRYYGTDEASTERKNYNNRHIINQIEYEKNPNYCVVCNKQLMYDFRLRQTCSEECYRNLLKLTSKNACIKAGGNLNPNGVQSSKYGTYKGFHCDSSWELAIVVYCLDNSIKIERNHTYFEYVYNNQTHQYYPDFIIEGVYTEIKNYWTERVQAKIDCFPKDLKYQIWYYDDVKHMLNYVQSKYGKDFCSVLYDADKPSFMTK